MDSLAASMRLDAPAFRRPKPIVAAQRGTPGRSRLQPPDGARRDFGFDLICGIAASA